MIHLPEEIFNTVLSFVDTRAHLAVGRSPNAKKMFLEGGPCLVLESILKHNADIKSLFKIKQYVPCSIALCKAVLTENIVFIKRVCILWGIRISNDAFALACRNQFAWGIEHLRPATEMTTEMYNRIYFELGQLDKIDLSRDRPFRELLNTDEHIKVKRLDYLPFKESLSIFELLYLYVLKGEEKEVFDIMDNDINRTIDFQILLFRSIREGACLLSAKLFRRYGSEYGVKETKIVQRLIMAKNVEALDYLNVPFIDVHRAIIQKDIAQINDYLAKERQSTMEVICEYDARVRDYFSVIMRNADIKLDISGFWDGMELEHQPFTFGDTDINDDMAISSTIEEIKSRKISDITYFGIAYGNYAPPPCVLLSFINMHGYKVLDDIRLPLYIVPYLTYVDIEATCQLMAVLLDCKYPMKQLHQRFHRFQHPKPAVYIADQTIYYTYQPIDSHKCHLENDLYTKLEFTDILFSKDIAVAFKTYCDMIQ